MPDYCEEMDKLNISQQMGHFMLIYYAMSVDVKTWSAIDATTVLAVAQSNRRLSTSKHNLNGHAIGQSDCLAGISYWIGVRQSAEVWAKGICSNWLNHVEGQCDALPTHRNDVDCAVNDVCEENETLMNIQTNEPLLYGEICMEVERIARRIAEGRHDTVN